MLNEIGHIEYDGVKYPYVFDINVIEIVQKEYGSITNIINELESMDGWAKPLKFVLREMINEAIDIQNELGRDDKLEFITLKKAGRIATVEFQMDSVIKRACLAEKIVKTLISEDAINKSENQRKNQ